MKIDKGWIAFGLQEYFTTCDYLDAKVNCNWGKVVGSKVVDSFIVEHIDLPETLNFVEIAESFNSSGLIKSFYRPKQKITPIMLYAATQVALPLYVTFHAAHYEKELSGIICIIEAVGTMKINSFKQIVPDNLDKVFVNTELVESRAYIKEYN